MRATNRLLARLPGRGPDADQVECPVCETRYDARPLNCITCGNTTFE